MIEIVLETPTTEERPSSAPAFMVQPPTLNPFVMPGSVALIKSDDHFDLEWINERHTAPTLSAIKLVDEFVARSRKEAERHSVSPRALTNLGVALVAAGKVEEAIGAFEGTLRLDGRHYPALAHLARLRLLQDELPKAEQVATRLRELFPGDAVAPMLLGCIALRRGHADHAVREIAAAAKLDKGSALPHYLLGMVLLGMRRNRDAIAHLRKATRLDNRSPTLQRGLGVAYASCGNLTRAIRSLRTSLALDPEAAETVHALGRVLMQHGDTESAIYLLTSFVDRNPRDHVGQELLAQVYKALNDHRAVRRHLQRALESLEGDDSVESRIERARVMNNIGVAYASFGALDEAERSYRKALDTAPHPISFRNLFGIYSERQESQAARRVLNQWLEMFPDDDEGALVLAVQLTETDDVSRGLSELRRLTKSLGVSARAYAALGYILSDSLRKMDVAIEILEEGYEQCPQNTAIANNLAYVYLINDMAPEARRVLEQINREDVESSVYLIATWGLLLLWEGKLADAKRHYVQAAGLAKQKGQNHLAQTAKQKMHLELARHYLRADDPQRASAEIREGLAIRGKKKYQEDLRELREGLLSAGRQSPRSRLTGDTDGP